MDQYGHLPSPGWVWASWFQRKIDQQAQWWRVPADKEDMVLCSTLSHPRFFFCGSLLRSKTSTIEVLRSENDDFEPIPSFGQAVPRIPSKCAEFYALDMPCWCLGQNLCGFIKIHRWKPTHFLQNFWEPPALATKTVKGFHTAALASACDTVEG